MTMTKQRMTRRRMRRPAAPPTALPTRAKLAVFGELLTAFVVTITDVSSSLIVVVCVVQLVEGS